MLDHEQIDAPQFHDEAGANGRADDLHGRTGLGTAGHAPFPMQAAGAALYLGSMMSMPLQIALAMPQVVVTERRNSSILRHLDWQRSRARAGQ